MFIVYIRICIQNTPELSPFSQPAGFSRTIQRVAKLLKFHIDLPHNLSDHVALRKGSQFDCVTKLKRSSMRDLYCCFVTGRGHDFSKLMERILRCGHNGDAFGRPYMHINSLLKIILTNYDSVFSFFFFFFRLFRSCRRRRLARRPSSPRQQAAVFACHF